MVWSQDEAIVRRACTTKIPVMSALGHTQDMTILDQVVWRSFATPSDAAHALCGMVRDHETQIKTVMQLIQGLIHQRMQSTRNTVERRFQATQMLTKHRITTYRNNVDLRYTMIQAV
jgi:exonuclease VII large subunit